MSDRVCRQLDPAAWDSKEFDLSRRYFIKGRVTSIFHMPLNIAAVIARLVKQAEAAGAMPGEYFALTDESSLWGADFLMEVTKSVAGADNELVTGRWLAKVFEGQYSKMGEWIGQMKAELKKRNREMGRLLFYYSACLKCAKKFGKNYVVIFAQI